MDALYRSDDGQKALTCLIDIEAVHLSRVRLGPELKYALPPFAHNAAPA